ncbi:carboxypeptidase regulatory-like domain-containing protein [Candidatus Kapabacteria bacterium]|nr:carboxypeptidase regulatory-like domain-containing protein [Candidatus Kapabacteria bacterium]
MFKHTYKTFLHLIMISGLLFGLSSSAFSQNQMRGIDANGFFEEEIGRLSIEWLHFLESDQELPNNYTIYASDEIDAAGNFSLENAEKIAELKLDDLNYNVIDSTKFMGLDGKLLKASWSTSFDIDEDVFFKVTAEIDREIVESNAFSVKEYEGYPEYIEIRSYPEQTILLNKEYVYDIKGFYDGLDEDEEISYRLFNDSSFFERNYRYPQNAEINTESGVIKWTPNEAGIYIFFIEAYLTDKPEVMTQQFVQIQVSDCEKETNLTVNVIDQDGNNVDGYLSIVSGENEFGYYNSNFLKVEDGTAKSKLTKGSFYLVFQGNDNQIEQWYNGAYGITEAEAINVDCGDSKEITMEVRSDIKEKDRYAIRFENTQKQATAVIDEVFNYTFNAEYSDDKDAKIIYTLINDNNEEVDFNTETGELSWTPKSKGYYSFTVLAKLEGKEYIRAYFSLSVMVSSCANPAIITGIVTDKDNNPIRNGFAFLYNKLENENGFGREYFVEILDGKFQIEVEEGEYIIGVQTKRGDLVYYENAFNEEDATPLSISCGETKEISFNITSQEYKYYTVSGYTSDENGNPVKASVNFDGRSISASGWEQNYSAAVVSDENGFYQIELPSEFEYRAYARLNNITYPLYYNQTKDPNKAEIIKLTGNLENINFQFDGDNEEFNINLKGSVVDMNQNLIENVLILVMNINDNGATNNSFNVGTISEDGNFNIKVAEGETIILAMPQTRDFLPGFYVDGDLATIAWEDATVLNFVEGEDQEIEIVMEEMGEIAPGSSKITGNVKENGTTVYISGADLVLEKDGKPVMYGNSLSDGSFGMANLPNGEYKIRVNKLGFKKFTTNINLDDSQSLDLEIPLEAEGIASVSYGVDAKTNISPNPASDEVTISLGESISNAKLLLLNIDGQLLLETTMNGFDKTLDIRALSSGSYIIKIESEDFNKAVPFIISK